MVRARTTITQSTMLLFNSLFLSSVLLLAARRVNCVWPNVIVDTVTCQAQQANALNQAFNEALAIAQVARARTVAAFDLTSPPGDRRVVHNNFQWFFGANTLQGLDFRKLMVLGRRF